MPLVEAGTVPFPELSKAKQENYSRAKRQRYGQTARRKPQAPQKSFSQ